MKTLGRFLKRIPNMAKIVMLNESSRAPGAALTLEGFADANFGGTPGMDRRSTDCAITVAGGVVMSASSQTQPGLPAMSSAESEIWGASRCAR